MQKDSEEPDGFRRETRVQAARAGSGASAAGLLGSAPRGRSSRLSAAPRVLVIGAGAAGLAAASRLAAAGADVTVLERDSRPGGRLRGGRGDGFTREPGAQVLSSGDRALRTLLAETGLESELVVLRSAGEGVCDGGWIHERHVDGWWPRRHLPVSPPGRSTPTCPGRRRCAAAWRSSTATA